MAEDGYGYSERGLFEEEESLNLEGLSKRRTFNELRNITNIWKFLMSFTIKSYCSLIFIKNTISRENLLKLCIY